MLSAINKSSVRDKCRLIAIEADESRFQALTLLMRDQERVDVRKGTFLDQIEEIERLVQSHSTFVFLDPFSVKGLDFDQLERVLRWIQLRRSVELLVNFNAPIFVRWGLAALGRSLPDADNEEVPVSRELIELNGVVGGEWWQGELLSGNTFPEQVQAIVDGYCKRLRQYFSEVCVHPIFAKSTDTVPKYVLVFGSRHPDALVLMNDEMVKARSALLQQEAGGQGMLFAGVPSVIDAELVRIEDWIAPHAQSPRERGAVIAAVIRDHFGEVERKTIRAAIERMLKNGTLVSESKKPRINDGVKIHVAR